MYHSHVGLQLDRGLYGPLLIEGGEDGTILPDDRGYTIMLDDFFPGEPRLISGRDMRMRGRGGMGRRGGRGRGRGRRVMGERGTDPEADLMNARPARDMDTV